MKTRLMIVTLGLTTALAPALTMGQAYPSRPITMVVPFAAGGPIDIIGRLFTGVSLAGVHIFGFVANSSLPVSNVKELVDYARPRSGQMNYGSSGIGTGPHLLGEAFKSTTGNQATHVPNKGGGPAVMDLMASRIDFMFDGSSVRLI